MLYAVKWPMKATIESRSSAVCLKIRLRETTVLWRFEYVSRAYQESEKTFSEHQFLDVSWWRERKAEVSQISMFYT